MPTLIKIASSFLNKLRGIILRKISLRQILISVILIIYISISHIILPAFNKSHFLFFSDWVLFSFTPREYVYDISWDEGKTFLLRDHKQKVPFSFNKQDFFKGNKFINSIFFNDYKSLQEKFVLDIKTKCQCENLQFFKLKGSIADHIIYKKQLEIEWKKAL